MSGSYVDPLQGNVMAISPDGAALAYVADGRIYHRPLDRLEATPVPGTEGGYSPFFSPDGQSIAFFTPTQLRRVSLAGGVPRPIAQVSNGYSGVWGPDGMIWFDLFGPTGVLRVPADGGEPEVMTTLAPGASDHGRIGQVFANGEALFGVQDGRSWESATINLHSPATGTYAPVMEGGSSARSLPSGHLIYAWAGGIYARPFDLERRLVGGDPRVLVEQVMHLHDGPPQFALSDTGTLAYLPGGAGLGRTRVLVWVNRQGNEVPSPLPPNAYTGWHLGPDGELAAEIVDQDFNFDVRLYDVERGTENRRLTNSPNIERFPIWTPDGGSVVVTVATQSGFSLVRLTREGVQEESWTSGPSGVRVPQAWVSDGSALLYLELSEDAGYDIWSMTLADETRRPVLQTPFSEYGPALSPDGRWLAYTSTESGDHEVYACAFPDMDACELVSRGGGRYPAWSRDGTELFYLRGGTMRAVPVDQAADRLGAGEPETLFSGDYLSCAFGFRRPYDIAPDGRFLMMKFADDPDEQERTAAAGKRIVVVRNWAEEVKARVPAR